MFKSGFWTALILTEVRKQHSPGVRLGVIEATGASLNSSKSNCVGALQDRSMSELHTCTSYVIQKQVSYKILLAVLPKESLNGTSPAKLPFDMTVTKEFYSVVHRLYCGMPGLPRLSVFTYGLVQYN